MFYDSSMVIPRSYYKIILFIIVFTTMQKRCSEIDDEKKFQPKNILSMPCFKKTRSMRSVLSRN